MDAESVVVELVARTEGFDGKMKQSASSFGAATASIENSATKAEAAIGRVGHASGTTRAALMEMQHVARGATDQFAAGTPFAQIFSQHIAQVGQAASLAGSSLGALGGFLGGPFGIAATVATVILAKLTLGHKDHAQAVEDDLAKLQHHAEATEAAREAQALFNRTLEGVTAALADDEEALQKLDDAQRTATENLAISTKAHLDHLKVLRGEAAAKLLLAKQDLQTQQEAANAPGQRGEVAAIGLTGKAGEINALEARLKDLDSFIGRADKDFADSLSRAITERATALADPIEAIKNKYEGHGGLIESTRRRLLAEKATTEELAKQVALLTKAEQKEIDAENAKKRKSPADNPFGRQVSFAEAASIARAAGLQVNSTQRTYAQQAALYNNPAVNRPGNPVARPGTSAHEGANGHWALDIQFAKGVTPDLLKKVFAAQGVNLTKVFKEDGHFHVEGSRSEAAAAESATARAEAKEASRVTAQTNLLDGLHERYAAALAALSKGTEDGVEQQKQAIDLARDDFDQKLAAKAKSGELDATAAAEAKRVNDATADLAKQLVDRADAEKRLRIAAEDRERDLATATGLNQNAQDLLHSQEALTRTQKERREIELKILDLAFQEEKLRAQAVIAARDALAAELAKKGPDRMTDADKRDLADANAKATVAQGSLDTLPQRQANAAAAVNRDTAGPLQQLFDSLPQTAEEVSQAFETIAAHGLDDLANSITDVITGAKSLGDAFKGVAQSIIRDIIQMIVKMLVFRAVSAAFGGGIFGSSGGGGEKFTLNGKRAGGGPVSAGGTYLVGERGPELFHAGVGGHITPNNEMARAVGGGGVVVNQHFVLDARGGITTTELLRHVNQLATSRAAQAGHAAYEAGQKAIPSRLQRAQRLGT